MTEGELGWAIVKLDRLDLQKGPFISLCQLFNDNYSALLCVTLRLHAEDSELEPRSIHIMRH